MAMRLDDSLPASDVVALSEAQELGPLPNLTDEEHKSNDINNSGTN
ncbi:hypothetical protein PC129_g6793 [Phytophthora cactorum]|uniref:Uncharacterized protein n=1 Tax=Phytophthora cactorum TaxID=29920 RepID=A0A329RQ00_9STRA|nr:hypothetical protein Pcac1_g15895 [Phytophthora cactorum]KAG3096233.1 hypothetical protein PI125_g16023 [Phytophthora idaei]KAG2829570.1 hypothetical protein PC112_g8037 [Phytophthora cactorum]KAG2829778.1 hypothetical protein PC111_g7641 [Phytophthora cactorum]KAG2859263.1 hypothetical protein PC113_g9109 [Phytophthora cactorum]